MLKSLKEFMSKVKPTDSKNLQDHAGIFEAAGKVKGLSYNFMDIKDSVSKLPNSALLKDLEPILDELESIGLDFAKHSDAYSKAKQSLQELDTSFASLNKKIEDAGPRFYNLAKKEAASGFWDKYLLLIITIVILIIVVVSIGVAIPFAIKYKKKKAAEKLEDLEKPVDKKKKKGKKSKDSKKSAEKKSTEKSSAMTAPTNSAQQVLDSHQ